MTDGRRGTKTPAHRKAISEGMKRANQRRKEQRVQQPTTDETHTLSKYIGEQFDSHGVYSLAAVADMLAKRCGLKLMAFGKDSVDLETSDGRILRLVGHTVRALVRSEGTAKVGPKGFTPNPGVNPDEVVVSGYVLSAQIARQLVGFHSNKMGRGSSFRDDLEALREAGL
jgi:hypothetical protein